MPAEDELPADAAERAIEAATREADEQGIHGKAVTPFVLERVTALTEGQSRKANVALLKNNARVGGEIAVALAGLRSG